MKLCSTFSRNISFFMLLVYDSANQNTSCSFSGKEVCITKDLLYLLSSPAVATILTGTYSHITNIVRGSSDSSPAVIGDYNLCILRIFLIGIDMIVSVYGQRLYHTRLI